MAGLFGSLVGVAVGCAYLGGAMARASELKTDAQRLDAATAAGFTDEALSAATGLDASALAIARRHDPYTVAGPSQRDREAELMTARLERLRQPEGLALRQVSLTGPAAQPFHLGGALDQSRDLECLTQAAYYEARGEGADGMRAVAQVVLNRVRHPAFPKTVCGVVFQGSGRRTGCQFSFTCDGSMRAGVNRAAWARARAVAASALSGGVHSGVGNATHFHTTAVAPVWRASMIRVTQVGQHLFYRFGGRTGAPGAFRYQPKPSLGNQTPQLVQASLDPTAPVRGMGEAVAYTALLARDALPGGDDKAKPEAQAAAPAKPAATAPAEAVTDVAAVAAPQA